MILIGKQGKLKQNALVVILQKHKRLDAGEGVGAGLQRWVVACFGAKTHYQQSCGSCVHVIEIVDNMKSNWYRSRTWYLPFGDTTKAEVKAWRL